MAEKSSWDQANRRQKLGLVWGNRKKISQIIKDYFYLPFFLLIILGLCFSSENHSLPRWRLVSLSTRRITGTILAGCLSLLRIILFLAYCQCHFLQEELRSFWLVLLNWARISARESNFCARADNSYTKIAENFLVSLPFSPNFGLIFKLHTRNKRK